MEKRIQDLLFNINYSIQHNLFLCTQFQVLLCNFNYSVPYPSFVCTRLNDQTISVHTIQFSISHLFTFSLNKCYHNGPHRQIAQSYIKDTLFFGGGLTRLQKCNRCIQQNQVTWFVTNRNRINWVIRCAFNMCRHLKLSQTHVKFSMLLLYILCNEWPLFYDFRFKSIATARIVIHPTKARFSQLVNFKNAIWAWRHFRRTICNKIVF